MRNVIIGIIVGGILLVLVIVGVVLGVVLSQKSTPFIRNDPLTVSTDEFR